MAATEEPVSGAEAGLGCVSSFARPLTIWVGRGAQVPSGWSRLGGWCWKAQGTPCLILSKEAFPEFAFVGN